MTSVIWEIALYYYNIIVIKVTGLSWGHKLCSHYHNDLMAKLSFKTVFYIRTLSGIGMCNKSSVTTLLWKLQFIEFGENREISRFLRFFTIFENAHNVQLFEMSSVTYSSTCSRLLKTILELDKCSNLKEIPK